MLWIIIIINYSEINSMLGVGVGVGVDYNLWFTARVKHFMNSLSSIDKMKLIQPCIFWLSTQYCKCKCKYFHFIDESNWSLIQTIQFITWKSKFPSSQQIQFISFEKLRIVRIIDSTCGFVDSRSRVQMSMNPFGGAAIWRPVIIE